MERERKKGKGAWGWGWSRRRGRERLTFVGVPEQGALRGIDKAHAFEASFKSPVPEKGRPSSPAVRTASQAREDES